MEPCLVVHAPEIGHESHLQVLLLQLLLQRNKLLVAFKILSITCAMFSAKTNVLIVLKVP